MAIERKELYVVTTVDGKQINAIAATFSECLQMFGEENVEKIEKLPYDEEALRNGNH